MKPCNNKIQSSYWAWNKAYTGIRIYTQQRKHIGVDTLVLLEPNPYPNSLDKLALLLKIFVMSGPLSLAPCTSTTVL